MGATATVYRGRDLVLQRAVAVKVFTPGGSHVSSPARQRIEMQTLAALDSPYLIRVFDGFLAEDDTDRSYLVLELVDGRTVSALIAADELLEPDVREIGRQIGRGLAAVHGLGFVHRDVKPGNIFVTGAGVAKLGDFGLVRALDPEHTDLTGAAVLGTAPYLSPEQVLGEPAVPGSDVYALGLVLLECLTGGREYTGQPVQAALARLLREPEVPDDLPAPWPGLLRAMTAREPALRPTAADVVRILAAPIGEPTIALTAPLPLPPSEVVADPRPVAVPDPVPMAQAERTGRARATWWVAAAVAAVVVAGVLVTIALRAHSAPTEPITSTVDSSAPSSQLPLGGTGRSPVGTTAPPTAGSDPVQGIGDTVSSTSAPSATSSPSSSPTAGSTGSSSPSAPGSTPGPVGSTSTGAGEVVSSTVTTGSPTVTTTSSSTDTSTEQTTGTTTDEGATGSSPAATSTAKNRGQSQKATRTKPHGPTK